MRPKTYRLTNKEWEKILSIPMVKYLKDALLKIKEVSEKNGGQFSPKEIHEYLRPLYGDKYRVLDRRYKKFNSDTRRSDMLRYEQVKGLDNIKFAINLLFKKHNINLKINQVSLKKYSYSIEEIRHHFIEFKIKNRN